MILDTNRQAGRLSYGRDGFRIFTYTSTLHLFLSHITHHLLLTFVLDTRYAIRDTKE